MDKRQMRIQHNFTQKYNNWSTPIWIDNFDARVSTFDIMERMDQLERQVRANLDYPLANELINKARSSNN